MHNQIHIIVCLHDDDILIIETHLQGIIEKNKYISSNFKMKNLGEKDTILGIKMKRKDNL